MKGRVSKIFPDKGYGFIRDTEGVQRFFHAKFVRNHMFDTLKEGVEVEFTAKSAEKGEQAVDIISVPGATDE